MRAAAKVEPLAGAVHGDRLVGGKLHHPFGLEPLALLLEEFAHLVAGPDLADQLLVGADDPPHLLLDRGEVLLGERPALGSRREIVIEAVVGRRAEGDLGAGKEVLHRLRKDVRVIVPDQLERVGLVARRDQSELAVLLERPGKVAHLAVDPRRERRLGQPRPDRRGDVRRRRPAHDLADRSIGQLDREHFGHWRSGS